MTVAIVAVVVLVVAMVAVTGMLVMVVVLLLLLLLIVDSVRVPMDCGEYISYHLEWLQTLQENPDHPILIIRYEECLQDFPSHIRKMADFIESPLTQEQIKEIAEAINFKAMKKRYEALPTGKLIRKGQVGDWKNWLTSDQSAELDKRSEKLKGTIFEPQFESEERLEPDNHPLVDILTGIISLEPGRALIASQPVSSRYIDRYHQSETRFLANFSQDLPDNLRRIAGFLGHPLAEEQVQGITTALSFHSMKRHFQGTLIEKLIRKVAGQDSLLSALSALIGKDRDEAVHSRLVVLQEAKTFVLD
ncbi:sulfotransferase [Plakobranchus ocellatus]|uniref:Sulfotransferase n=1 Tax=Plakobranchus ocellatus TaxID=259542 RepID=A0AAV4ATA3_9GAST|nr:sulfotransferase [Plakobranchus ocellatus]